MDSASSSARTVAACVIGGIVLGASVVALHLGAGPAAPSLPPVEALRRRFRRRHRPVRVYMDGCFDMMHYGHCNALRQARALGDELVVGVVSDDEITANKGPPVTPLHERMKMVRAVKWVDDVIPDAPYAITEDFMNKLFNEYNIDYIIHGDDPCLLPDGTDAYALAKKAGRYKQIKRTEGVSTTDIEECFFVLERDQFLIIRATLHYKDSSVMGMVRILMIVDLEMEQKYLIFFPHLGG
uniref:ethanolamine-phosphate cytidylyltransferase n=1 Tax=Aegilops tauschii subsp. strangulata TaxID=200361 RepID=A0A453HPF3_AEGTS